MSTKSTVSASIDSLTGAIDSVSFDSIPDLDVPDLSGITDAFGDATTVVTDTAVVIGQRGGRLANRTARAAWANRETVATVAVVAVILLALASLAKRRKSDDDES